MFKDTVYQDRNKPKDPDIILSDSTFSTEIFPVNLADFSSMTGVWTTVHKAMKPGQNGVYLVVRVDGKKVTETLTLDISQE